MNPTLLIALTASVALAAPFAAQAQQAVSPIAVSGTVGSACDVGAPDNDTLDLNTLTGADGRITSTLAGAAVAVSTTLPDAWCSAPSQLKVDASPMALQSPALATTPAGFSRLVTYNATVTGWPTNAVDRPLVGVAPGAAATVAAAGAHASDLVLQISALASLNAAGVAAESNPLEAGNYLGSVIISVSVQ